MRARSVAENTGRKHLCFDRLLDEQPDWALWPLFAARYPSPCRKPR